MATHQQRRMENRSYVEPSRARQQQQYHHHYHQQQPQALQQPTGYMQYDEFDPHAQYEQPDPVPYPPMRRSASAASDPSDPRPRHAARAHSHHSQSQSYSHSQGHQQYMRPRGRSTGSVSSGEHEGAQYARGSLAQSFQLSRREKLDLIRQAKDSAMALTEHAHTLDGPVQWLYKGLHRGIQIYEGTGSLAGENGTVRALAFLCGVTTMLGTLEEVSAYFDQSTTPRMRAQQADDVVDCAALFSLVAGNTVNPFHRVAVKYVALEAPMSMARKRDFCYLECQDTFRHSTGRRGWVLSMHSIALPCCPEVPGFVRGAFHHSGFVFVESERNGYMDVMYSLQINIGQGSRTPQFLLQAALKRRLRELIRVSRGLQLSRIAHRTLLHERDLMPKRLRNSCSQCSRKFWLLLRKTRCRVCGDVVCQSCAPELAWDEHGEVAREKDRGAAKTRVCMRCYSESPAGGSYAASHSGTTTSSTGAPMPLDAPSDEHLPWTERSRIQAIEAAARAKGEIPHKALSPQSAMLLRLQGVAEAEEEEEEDQDEDEDEAELDTGRYTFAELEEQSSRSVFAPERFARSSVASSTMTSHMLDDMEVDFDEEGPGVGSAPPHSGVPSSSSTINDDNSSEFSLLHSDRGWPAHAADDPLFDRMGSFSESEASTDDDGSSSGNGSGSGRFRPGKFGTQRGLRRQPSALMEEPEEEHEEGKRMEDASGMTTRATTETMASVSATPMESSSSSSALALAVETSQVSASPDGSKSSYEFLDNLLDMPTVTRHTVTVASSSSHRHQPTQSTMAAAPGAPEGGRQRAQTTLASRHQRHSQLNAHTLHAHNQRFRGGSGHLNDRTTVATMLAGSAPVVEDTAPAEEMETTAEMKQSPQATSPVVTATAMAMAVSPSAAVSPPQSASPAAIEPFSLNHDARDSETPGYRISETVPTYRISDVAPEDRASEIALEARASETMPMQMSMQLESHSPEQQHMQQPVHWAARGHPSSSPPSRFGAERAVLAPHVVLQASELDGAQADDNGRVPASFDGGHFHDASSYLAASTASMGPPPSANGHGDEVRDAPSFTRSSTSSFSSALRGASFATTSSSVMDSTRGSHAESNASLFSRPSSMILRQVRKNRARSAATTPGLSEEEMRNTESFRSVEDEHRRRMEELHRLARQYAASSRGSTVSRASTVASHVAVKPEEMSAPVNDRVSTNESTKSTEPVRLEDEEAWRSSSMMDAYRARRKNTIESLRQKTEAINNGLEPEDLDQGHMESVDDHRQQQEQQTGSASRSPSFAGRGIVGVRGSNPYSSSSSSSTAGVATMEAPVLVNGNREHGHEARSSGDLTVDVAASRTSGQWPKQPEREPEPTAVRLSSRASPPRPSHRESTLRSSSGTPPRPQPKWQPTQTPPRGPAPVPRPPPAHPPAPDAQRPSYRRSQREFVSANSLYKEIGVLAELRSEMAEEAANEAEQDRIKDRIRDQYQLIRKLKLQQ